MTTDLATAKTIREELGFTRSSLLRWEAQGLLEGAVVRTPGGQRRYRRSVLRGMVDGQTQKQAGGDAAMTRPPDRPFFGEFGVSGLRRWGGAVHEERLRELRGRAGRLLLREMRMNSPVLGAVFMGVENAMRRVSKRVKPASEGAGDRAAAEHVESCFHDMSWSWRTQFTFIMEMLEQGFSLLEVCYKRRLGQNPPAYCEDPAPSLHDDGKVGWRKWAPRPATSLASWIFDDAGGILGINQQPEGDWSYEIKPIPISKLLHFRTTAYPANSPEGLPIHRTAYVPWYYSKQMMEVEGIGVERDLAGLPIVYLGRGTSLQGTNSDYAKSQDLVVNIRIDEQAGIVVPHPKLGTAGEGEGMLVDLLTSGGTRAHNVDRIIGRYDKRMALSCLAQFIMLGMERVGSYALSRHQGDLFVLAVTAWLSNIADVINRHAIPPLVRYNAFSGLTGYPELVFGSVGIPDLKEMSDYVNSLVQARVLEPDAELERHLRQLADLPQPHPVEVSAPSPTGFPTSGGLSEGDKARASQAAQLLGRVMAAAGPLAQLGTLSVPEMDALARPALDELRGALGVEEGELLEGLVKVDGRVDWPSVAGLVRGQQGQLEPGQVAMLKQARDEGWTADEFLKSHVPEVVSRTCPLCGYGEADSYAGHGGLLVCRGCGKTFDPAVEKWQGEKQGEPVEKATAAELEAEDEKRRKVMERRALSALGDLAARSEGAGKRVRDIPDEEWERAEAEEEEEV